MNSNAQGPVISKWGIILLLMILCICGAFLRFWNLGSQSFWVDEVNALYAAQSWMANGEFTLPSGWVYDRAVIYTFITAFLYKGFGVSEWATRFPSAFFGLLSILISYVLGTKIFNKKVGLLTAFLVAFSHFEVGWSRTAKMYTLLQCFTLVFVYTFIKAFETDSRDQDKIQMMSKLSKSTILQRMIVFLNKSGISPLWLFITGLVFIISYRYVHQLIFFLLGGIFLYFVFFAFINFIDKKGRERIVNKYSIILSSIVLIAGFIWIAFPYLHGAIFFFLSYTPSWATGESSAQDKLALFDFLISSQRFPIAAFFFIGSFQLFSRQSKQGWIPFWFFVCPLFLLSFMFTHRVPTYLFYVYPLFLMISAFGFVNLLESEMLVLSNRAILKKKWMKQIITTLLLSVFIISPWFRITLHIPFVEDGVTNLAVTPNEWREASKIVIDSKQEYDIIISSLPQVALYYGLHSDYVLNLASLIQSREQKFFNNTGRVIDIYSGTVCIES
ncbi:glycosyltransferase family 39 protein, partial [bacterium]|nr:glycosyltransferase family 39 protein [bacterium]